MVDETEELFDISNYSYEEFLDFCFDRPEDWGLEKTTGNLRTKIDLSRTLEYLIRFFENPEPILARFGPGQIENGLLELLDPGMGIFMHYWDLDTPWERFEATVRAMETLSRKLFALPGLEKLAAHWWVRFIEYTPWDWIASDATGERFDGYTQEYEQTLRIAEVILDVLERLLDSDSPPIRSSALRGLACLRSEKKAAIIDEYLKRSNLDGELKTIALAARDRHGRLPPNNLDFLSYEEWVRFVFDREVSEPTWDEDADWDFIATLPKLLDRSTRLLRNARELRQEYSSAQLEQGFWYLASCGSEIVVRCVWDTSLPYEKREELVLAMENLYTDLFQFDPLDSSSFMWWDLVLGDLFRPDIDDPYIHWERDREDEKRLQEVFFGVLCRILSIDSRACQESALHGLGHLWHPGRAQVIDRFIEKHAEIDEELKKYALRCREGKMP